MKHSETDDATLADSELATPGPAISHAKMDTFTQPEVTSKLVESNTLNVSPKFDVPPKTDDSTLSEATSIPDVAPIPDVTAKPRIVHILLTSCLKAE